MSTDARQQLLDDLLRRVLEERPGSLSTWLDRQGIDDWQVREELISRIHHPRSLATTSSVGDLIAATPASGPVYTPGQALGSYRIIRELGRGGMGHVYLAEDSRLGRRVALKALSPGLTSEPSHRERLRREARAAAALSHPGICTVYALEELDGDLFIAAEFIDGHTLRHEIAAGRRPASDDVSSTARELANALAAAHGSGVVHRDLKPENIMRTVDGRLKVLDFGLARMDPASAAPDRVMSNVTQPGVILGTPAYMAPEQLNGHPADMRSDVFALGVLLYEYATGTHPFHAPQPLALVGRILESHAEPLDRRRTDLPASLALVIDRCLRKIPSERFASAVEIDRELDRATVAAPVARMASWWRAHQLAIVALYLAACGLTWQVKEWLPGVATTIFPAACVVATIAAVFRGHLLFVERVNAPRLTAERHRARPVVTGMDLALALLLIVDGVMLTGGRPVVAVLTIALGLGIALANLIIEPATTSATFGTQS